MAAPDRFAPKSDDFAAQAVLTSRAGGTAGVHLLPLPSPNSLERSCICPGHRTALPAGGGCGGAGGRLPPTARPGPAPSPANRLPRNSARFKTGGAPRNSTREVECCSERAPGGRLSCGLANVRLKFVDKKVIY